jgi:hypothetical protein
VRKIQSRMDPCLRHDELRINANRICRGSSSSFVLLINTQRHRLPNPGGELLCRLAVLSDGSKRFPGIVQRDVSTQPFRSVTWLFLIHPIDLRRARPFPGAACCQPTELLSYKAAPVRDRHTIPLGVGRRLLGTRFNRPSPGNRETA